MIGLASGLLALAGLFAERAIAITRSERLAGRLGVTRPVRETWSPDRWVFTGLGFPFLLIAAGPVIAIVGAGCVVLIVFTVRRRRRSGRRKRAAEQVADAVSAVAAGLRAGLSLPQAFAYARDEAEEPLRGELEDLVDAIDTGIP